MCLTFITMLLGSSIVLMVPKKFDPGLAWRTLEEKRPNVVVGVGDTQFLMMIEAFDKGEYNTDSLVAFVSAGMPLSPRIRKMMLERVPNAFFIDWYGATENAYALFHVYIKETKDEPTSFKRSAITEVFDERGMPVPPGVEGELAQCGGSSSREYYKDPEKTSEIRIRYDGKSWVLMGDRAKIDEKGYISIVGRGSDVINTGGIKVWPKEVEETISKHQKVNDCAVVGVPDEKWGEAVVAVVQCENKETMSEEEVTDWCRGKMAGYKIPKHVIFNEIVKTEAGKTWSKVMKDMATEKLGR